MILEASGGVTLANIRDYAEAGAHIIAVGAVTHSVRAVDIAAEILDDWGDRQTSPGRSGSSLPSLVSLQTQARMRRHLIVLA